MDYINTHCFVNVGESWFQQILGIAMGRSDGVHLATLAVHMIEHDLSLEHPELLAKCLLHVRYIDDLCMVFRNTDLDSILAVIKFYESRSNMKWNMVYVDTFDSSTDSESINMLDVSIFRTPCRLAWKPFSKPTFLGSYIPPHSLHPSHVHRSWIPNELFRIARNSFFKEHFVAMAQRFYDFLRCRGFSPKFLSSLFSKFKYSDAISIWRDSFVTDAPREHLFRDKHDPPREFFYLAMPFGPATRGFKWTSELNHLFDVLHRKFPHIQLPRTRTAWTSLSSLGTISSVSFENRIGDFNPNLNPND